MRVFNASYARIEETISRPQREAHTTETKDRLLCDGMRVCAIQNIQYFANKNVSSN